MDKYNEISTVFTTENTEKCTLRAIENARSSSVFPLRVFLRAPW